MFTSLLENKCLTKHLQARKPLKDESRYDRTFTDPF